MEKVKEFLKNPKKTAILGLVFCTIIVLLKLYSVISNNLLSYMLMSILYMTKDIGLTIYFAIIVMNMSKQKGNVEMAKNLLILFVAISTIFSLIPFRGFNTIIPLLVNVIFIMYLYNIFYKKFEFVNNKVFLCAMVVYIAIYNIYPLITSPLMYLSIYDIIQLLANIAFIPYFYNYYNWINNAKDSKNKKLLEEMGIGEKKAISATNEEDKDIRRDIYALFCKEITANLKAPSTAVFCKEEELQIVKQNNMYYVSGWVDSQNSYGAMVRTNIKNFKIKDENGILMIKSNAKVMASNSFIKLFAANWVFSLIVTVITFVIIYAIISSL